MPKLTKGELNRRAQRLKNLYVKYKGNKSRIAKELDITPQAIGQRFDNPIGKEAQHILEIEIAREAKKIGVDIRWYLKKLKEGSIKPMEIVFNKLSKIPDYAVRHKYLVTLGEILKYIRSQSVESGQKVQVFVGAEISHFVKTAKTKQARSDAGPD